MEERKEKQFRRGRWLNTHGMTIVLTAVLLPDKLF